VTEDLGKEPGIIGTMAGDSDGNIWFAFLNKLVEWDGSTYHRFSFSDGNLDITVAVVAVRRDHIWMGGARRCRSLFTWRFPTDALEG
jgi:hypothetical protein